MPEWLLPTLTFVAGAGMTWLLLRIRFERFEAMDTRREADWAAWRRNVDSWMSNKEMFDHKWRHDEYTPYVSALALDVAMLKTKMERVEHEMNGKQRGRHDRA